MFLKNAITFLKKTMAFCLVADVADVFQVSATSLLWKSEFYMVVADVAAI